MDMRNVGIMDYRKSETHHQNSNFPNHFDDISDVSDPVLNIESLEFGVCVESRYSDVVFSPQRTVDEV